MLEAPVAEDVSGGVGDGAVIFFFSVTVVVVKVVVDTATLLAEEVVDAVVDGATAEEASINPAEIRVQTENEYRKRV